MIAPIDLLPGDILNVLHTQGDYNLVSIERDGRIIWRRGVMSGEANTKHQLEGGTTRSEKAPRFDLMPKAGSIRIATRFGLGAAVHGEGNWMKSIHESERTAHAFCREAYNHMLVHSMNMLAFPKRVHEMDTKAVNVKEDDDLGAIGWAVFVIAYAEDYWGKKWTDLGRETEDPSKAVGW